MVSKLRLLCVGGIEQKDTIFFSVLLIFFPSQSEQKINVERMTRDQLHSLIEIDEAEY